MKRGHSAHGNRSTSKQCRGSFQAEDSRELVPLWTMLSGNDAGVLSGRRWRIFGPSARYDSGMVAAAGKVFVFGGVIGLAEEPLELDPSSNDCWMLNQDSLEWMQLSPQVGARWPSARSRFGVTATTDGHHLVLFGGNGDSEGQYAVDDVGWKYCINSREWEPLPPGPSARCDCIALAVQQWVIVFGGLGTDESTVQDVCWRLHLDTGNWEQLSNGPSPRCEFAAVAVDGWMVVVGGENSELELVEDVCWRLHIATGQWEPIEGGPSPRSGCAAVTAAGDYTIISHLTAMPYVWFTRSGVRQGVWLWSGD